MQTILIQLDTDPLPSSFDRVVAVDAGANHVFSYGGVTPESVEPLIHGAMFTRGGPDLKNTAIFISGSKVADGEVLFGKVKKTFFGPVRVSVMLDSNGSNTTAAAAVLSAGKHLTLSKTKALVLGGTGPVGQRAAELLALQGAEVRIGSRSLHRAKETCAAIADVRAGANVSPCETDTPDGLRRAMSDVELIIAAGAPSVQFLSAEQWKAIDSLQVAIDVNAVAPTGLDGIEVTDKAVERDRVVCYGALGVGGLKMKIHKAAIARLFEANDQLLDTEAIYGIGADLLKQ